jgi:hypothetical protein
MIQCPSCKQHVAALIVVKDGAEPRCSWCLGPEHDVAVYVDRRRIEPAVPREKPLNAVGRVLTERAAGFSR